VNAGQTDTPPPAGEKKKQSNLMHSALSVLYQPCAVCNEIITLANKRGVDPIMERIAKGIHEGKIKPGYVDQDLYEWIAKQLFEGVRKGFGGDFNKFTDGPMYDMLASLQTNVHVFSAFKTYQQLREATDLLTDANGNIKSFADFKRDIDALNVKYNVTYLNAEYNQAIASSQMAATWVDYEAAGGNLKYQTAGDDHVRESHAALDGIVKPVDDVFWNTYYPPNDWGCRCDVTPDDSSPVTKARGKLPKLPEMFRTNTAKSGVVFPEKHPYYEVAKQDRKAAKKNFNMPIPNGKKK
jgi:SPP1 gp7 family putative phage head morphogenesis protein